MTNKNLRKNPYRGILAEIARELGVKPQTINRRRRNRDPKILTLITAKVNEREAAVSDYDAAMAVPQS